MTKVIPLSHGGNMDQSRRCRRCHRYLPSLASQARGLGPVCRARLRQEQMRPFKTAQRLKARRGLRVRPFRGSVYQVTSGPNRYLTTSQACNCASGRYRGKVDGCWHVLAVRLHQL